MGTMLSWFSSLFMRDGRPLELFSSIGVFGWAVLSGVSTENNVIPPSMDGVLGLVSPATLVDVGCILSVVQLVALATLVRWIRAPVAFALSFFMGVLTIGVWFASKHSPGTAFFLMAWGMNIYISIRLCRPRP